jgi:hypothetical protein
MKAWVGIEGRVEETWNEAQRKAVGENTLIPSRRPKLSSRNHDWPGSVAQYEYGLC